VYPNEEACELKRECLTKVLNYGTVELLEDNTRKDVQKKGQPSQEATQAINSALGGVVQEKKKRNKRKDFSSDIPSEAPPTREYELQVKDNIQISMEKDSKVPEKPGITRAFKMRNFRSSVYTILVSPLLIINSIQSQMYCNFLLVFHFFFKNKNLWMRFGGMCRVKH
jgi:hypothetical protein